MNPSYKQYKKQLEYSKFRSHKYLPIDRLVCAKAEVGALVASWSIDE